MNKAMLATDKQCEYLTALAKRVDGIIKKHPGLAVVPKRDWYDERDAGMTANDASEKITAYHSLIIGLRLKIDLLGL